MRTLYMTDLDGTILPKGDEIPDSTVKIINALISHGLAFTINTSRTPQSAAPPLRRLNLKLPAILMNGGCFYDFSTGTGSDYYMLDSGVSKSVVSAVSRFGLNPFVFNCEDGDVFVNYINAKTAAEKKFIETRINYYKRFERSKDFIITDRIAYIVCVGERAKLQSVKKELDKLREISCSLFISNEDDYCFLEIYLKDAGKANAAKRFKEKYGFDKIVAFGDNLNDTEMLRFADTGIAVANAADELKAIANTVIGRCETGAVADYLLIEWSRQLDLI